MKKKDASLLAFLSDHCLRPTVRSRNAMMDADGLAGGTDRCMHACMHAWLEPISPQPQVRPGQVRSAPSHPPGVCDCSLSVCMYVW